MIKSIGKSLKKEINWCLNHVNIMSGSKVMIKSRHQNLYAFWTDLRKCVEIRLSFVVNGQSDVKMASSVIPP